MFNLFDLEEEHDPNLPYVDGSDLDGAWSNQDDIDLTNKNWSEAYETDINQMMKEMDPCCGRYCNECEIGGCPRAV